MGSRQVHLLNRVGARTSGIVFSSRRIYRLNATTFPATVCSMAKRKSKQLDLADFLMQKRMGSGHGGPRKGAGAKRSIRARDGTGAEPHSRGWSLPM